MKRGTRLSRLSSLSKRNYSGHRKFYAETENLASGALAVVDSIDAALDEALEIVEEAKAESEAEKQMSGWGKRYSRYSFRSRRFYADEEDFSEFEEDLLELARSLSESALGLLISRAKRMEGAAPFYAAYVKRLKDIDRKAKLLVSSIPILGGPFLAGVAGVIFNLADKVLSATVMLDALPGVFVLGLVASLILLFSKIPGELSDFVRKHSSKIKAALRDCEALMKTLDEALEDGAITERDKDLILAFYNKYRDMFRDEPDYKEE